MTIKNKENKKIGNVNLQEKAFDFSDIEKKWQKKWEEGKVFEVNPDKRKNTKWDRWARLVMAGYDLFHINEHLFFYRMTEYNVSQIGKRVNDARKSGDLNSVSMLMTEDYWGTA